MGKSWPAGFAALARQCIIAREAHELTGFHSGGEKSPYLWRSNGEGYDGALLCRHGCSFHTQRLHVHPAMTPDGKGIVFTSDPQGYGNIYLVEIPEFEVVPPVGPTSAA